MRNNYTDNLGATLTKQYREQNLPLKEFITEFCTATYGKFDYYIKEGYASFYPIINGNILQCYHYEDTGKWYAKY